MKHLLKVGGAILFLGLTAAAVLPDHEQSFCCGVPPPPNCPQGSVCQK